MLVKEGYSLQDIEQMDVEQYEYLVQLILESKTKMTENPLARGL